VLPVDYADEWPPTGGHVAGHHRPSAYALARLARPWDQLAVQAVTRDRHRVDALTAFVQ